MKRSLRDFLFTLFLSVVIFSIVAFFVLQFVENLMVDVVDKVQDTHKNKPTQTVTEEVDPTGTGAPSTEQPPAVKSDKILTFCIVGVDHNKVNADLILYGGVNETKKEMTVTLVPTNTTVYSANTTLGALYASQGVAGIQNFLAEETGLTADYFAVFTMDGFANMIDILGGVTYSVPEAMTYFDSAQGLKINLAAGTQTLNGDQALGLLAYRGYGDTQRENTQISFVRAFIKAFLTSSNIANAKNVLTNLSYHLSTNFSSNDFNQYADWIFIADSCSLNVRRIPGAGSGGRYEISAGSCESLFASYH